MEVLTLAVSPQTEVHRQGTSIRSDRYYRAIAIKGVLDEGSLQKTWPTISPQQVTRASIWKYSFRNYLEEVSQAGDVTAGTADLAWKAWERLSQEMGGGLPVPDAATGAGGELLLTWDQNVYHLEMEFLPDSTAEFFFRHRETGALWGELYRPDAPLSAEVRKRLRMFL